MSCSIVRRAIIGPPYDYLQLLQDCIASKSLALGKTVHQHLLKNSTHKINYIELDRLTRLYIACNELHLARRVFNTIPDPEKKDKVILWNHIIRAYAWAGPFQQAIDLYYEMIESGVTPSKYTYPFVLKACSGLQAVEDGKEVHHRAKRFGLDKDLYVCTALIDLYSKSGCLVDARMVFDEMQERDVVAWNAMVSGFSFHGFHSYAVNLVEEMQGMGVSANSSTVVAVLPAIGGVNKLHLGKAVHGYCVRKSFESDVVVGTGVLDMYAKCGCLSYARRVFNLMGVMNEVTWSAMIGAYVMCDSPTEALELFDRVMFEDAVIVSPVMVGTVLRACAQLTDVGRGRSIHGYAIKSGFVLDVMVGNTLVSMYAKCGLIEDALRFFDEIDSKDAVSYSAIISGCVQNGNAEKALHIFHKMQLFGIDVNLETMLGFLPACSHLAALQHGTCGHSYSIVSGFTPDTSIGNALIDMYCKCGQIDMARLVFDRMHKKDLISWNSMIVGYGIHGLGMEGLLLFRDMQAVPVKPDDVTFIGLLSACSHSGLVEEGKHWFVTMSQNFNIIPRMEHYLCMVDLLGRAGQLKEAYIFIQTMPFKPDVRIWSALLAACRVHKNIKLAEEISNNIQNRGAEGTGNFVLLSNIYSAAGRWDDAADIRIMQRDLGFKKSPGCSWVEISGTVHAFIGGDKSHPQWSQINKKLQELLVKMKTLGYRAESSFVLQDVEEEENEQILLNHSEKLAVAFAVLTLSPCKPILVTKNLRVCGDCHTALKFITIITKRKITVRDANRFHHFEHGTCNCRDFW